MKRCIDLATPAQMAAFWLQALNVLDILGARIARAVIAGPLTEQQAVHLESALTIVDGLRTLFTAERARMAGSIVTRTGGES